MLRVVKDQAMGVVMRNRNGWMWESVLDELIEVHKKGWVG
jgi:hypothetical protein